MNARPSRAMILAAGMGSRLGQLGAQTPKPMFPICGLPLVSWAVGWLVKQGIEQIVVNLHHHGEQIKAALGDGSAFGAQIQYSHEPKLLGTGGGIAQARPWLDDGTDAPIVVVNGKLVHDLNLSTLTEHHDRQGAEATMVVRDDREGVWGAPLKRLPNGCFARFLDETYAKLPARRASEDAAKSVMFCGIQLLSRRFLDRLPEEGCIVRSAYRQLYQQSPDHLQTFLYNDYWWEHSTPERYVQGVRQVLAGQCHFQEGPYLGPSRHASAEVHPTAEINSSTYVGAQVRVGEGARIGPGVQLLPGCRVAPGVVLTDSVVWYDAVAKEHAEGKLIE